MGGIVWLGIGAHLGRTAEANDTGDFCCEVTNLPGLEAGRGFASDAELGFHNDVFLDTVGMLSISHPLSGGAGYFSSLQAAFEDVVAEAPDETQRLFEGWPLVI